MSLTVRVNQQKRERLEVVLDGSLDSDTDTQLEAALESAITPATRHVTFNMSGLKYISSAGIRVVAMTTKAMKDNGGAVAITELQPQIRRVFDIIKALPSMGVFASHAEADAYFAEMQRQVLEEGK